MDSALRGVIHDLVLGRESRPEPWTLGARAILTQDARQLLQGSYGVHDNGRIEPEDALPNLAHDPEARETYRRLVAHLQSEQEAGLSGREAVDKLVKEVAFTHLNRLVAFKMLEARGLIRGTLARYPRPNGFLRYLAEHSDDERRYNAGDDEGAFRRFLLWQSGQIATEIRVLFDPDSLASRLFPRRHALRDLIALLNDPGIEPAWGEEETIGWVYQYFNEQEKKDVFARLSDKRVPTGQRKIRREDVPAATQLFTPRWIVAFLTQNTLGRTWLQMHPDSNLAEQMPYLVPLAGEIPPEQPKPVRELTVLDPACGTMHFGLVAFDLLAAMYREELAHAGQPGWPEAPSVASEAEIPAAIVANNLFGIDIDLRAVQLAALALYLKAKSLNKDAVLAASNLVSADVLPFRQRDLDDFLAEMRFTRPVYANVLRALWPKLAELSELGSLARLERALDEAIAGERARRAKEERENPLLVDIMGDFGPALAAEDQWQLVEDQIIQALGFYAKTAAERGADVTFFAGEATKGLRLLDLMRRCYDVVVTNPPYRFASDLESRLAEHLKEAYPRSADDLYSAFIERCADWLVSAGRLGMITQRSFMYTLGCEKLRQDLSRELVLEVLAETGAHTFAEIKGENVSTAAFILRHDAGVEARGDCVGTYFRLVKEPYAEAKQVRFKRAIEQLQERYADPLVFRYRQADFDAIPGSPWVYWVTPGLRELFQTLPRLEIIAKPRQGLATADNPRFLRYWWEPGVSRIAFGCHDQAEASGSGKRWFPHMKGGEYRKWYGNQEYVVNWWCNGEEIRNFRTPSGRTASRPQNTNYYFQEGMTWSDISSAPFAVRWMPPGFVFDHAGNAVFPSDGETVLSLMAVLNSQFTYVILEALNSTLHVYIEDLNRLPVPDVADSRLNHLVSHAIALARAASAADETTYDFTAPLPWRDGLEVEARRVAKLAGVEREIDEEVYRLYGIGDQDRAAIEAELALTPDPSPDGALRGRGEVAENEDETAGENGEAAPEISLTRQELAVRWVSYAVGIVMGRFRPGVEGEGALGSGIVEDLEGERRHVFAPEVEAGLRELADADGIVVLDAGHPDDLAGKVEQALELMLGAAGLREVVADVGGNLVKFLQRDFFVKWHLNWYRAAKNSPKRPVYWLVQSPKRSYGLYLFHERITPDTLFLVQRRYVDTRLTALGHRVAELRAARNAVEGRERKRLERELDDALAQQEDVAELGRRLRRVTERGYAPDLDDGVILNLAPLWEVVPAWPAEPKKYWQALERGDYDWSHLAMRYWPERVEAKCRTDKSFAIAHGRMDLYAEPARV